MRIRDPNRSARRGQLSFESEPIDILICPRAREPELGHTRL
jgi:hypothetical protein